MTFEMRTLSPIGTLLLVITMLLLVCPPAWGQEDEYPRTEVFGGGSFLNADFKILRHDFYGWQTSASRNVHRNVGFTVDFGGQYKSLQLGPFGNLDLQVYQILLGPRFTARNDTATTFVHTLFGVIHSRAGGLSDTSFAMGFGVGVDVNVSSWAAVRIFQIDYIPNVTDGVWFHEGRFAAGVVFKWGQ